MNPIKVLIKTRNYIQHTLCNMIAKKTIISTSDLDVVAAAPNAIPSAAKFIQGN